MDWITAHLTGAAVGYGIAWIVAALAYALPTPTESDGRGYVIAYRLLHFAGANLERMRSRNLPAPQDPPAR